MASVHIVGEISGAVSYFTPGVVALLCWCSVQLGVCGPICCWESAAHAILSISDGSFLSLLPLSLFLSQRDVPAYSFWRMTTGKQALWCKWEMMVEDNGRWSKAGKRVNSKHCRIHWQSSDRCMNVLYTICDTCIPTESDSVPFWEFLPKMPGVMGDSGGP